MSDQIKKCRTCSTPVKDFETSERSGDSYTCHCTTCGHTYELFFMPGTRKEALVLEDHGVPAAQAATEDTAPAEAPERAAPAAAASSEATSAAVAEPVETAGEADAVSGRTATGPDGPGRDGRDAAAEAEPAVSQDRDLKTSRRAHSTMSKAGAPDTVLGMTAAEINLAVGRKVLQFRKMRDLSQEKLARKVGITFQQVQKYERGANRITPDRLMWLAAALDVPVSAFFEDIDPRSGERADIELQTKHFDLIRIFESMQPKEREHIYRLMRAVSQVHDDVDHPEPQAAE